ncbi:unnamed protein product [Lepeophtheirus salmonis]|uniref:(salmon louse) hypothetical protein n=1 Tax=Lepeophtheirus salmonis TaxID=72036 RepID=A0A7R8CQI0_LEPSM|nr:unnamed protein product [Lepeophtheirus salmonis]CAF2895245.1 unnamed protein product [Lepeophtheirus salmonis]
MPYYKGSHAENLCKLCLACLRKSDRPISETQRNFVQNQLFNFYTEFANLIPTGICSGCRLKFAAAQKMAAVSSLLLIKKLVDHLQWLEPITRLHNNCHCEICNIARIKGETATTSRLENNGDHGSNMGVEGFIEDTDANSSINISNQEFIIDASYHPSDANNLCFQSISKDNMVLICVVLTKAEGLEAHSLLSSTTLILNHCNIDINHCVGQCYDGASVMPGSNNGVQEKFRKEVPQAIYIHCYAHRLYLVLVDSVRYVKLAS